MASSLVEIDELSILVVVDNEVDPLSRYTNSNVAVSNRFIDIAVNSPQRPSGRGEGCRELRMSSLCCGAHGLSLLITATAGGKKRTMLFDTGPEEAIWQLNAERLQPDLASVDLIHLSHWHRDHSGGMLAAIRAIKAAKARNGDEGAQGELTVDLHPARPDFRGIKWPDFPISLEADPSFEQIENAGATVSKNDHAHTVLDDMFLVSGFIPRQTMYEQGLKGSIRFNESTGQWEDDVLIADERLVMCKVKGKGIIMFTGCSHAGVINAARLAAGLGAPAPLHSVIGGYHLADAEEIHIEETVRDLLALEPKVLMPGHCSGWRVKQAIEATAPGLLAPSTVGTRFTF